MTLKFRRFLYIFFILIFIILTPILWLYAAGYKLGNGFMIKKTGILIIDSKPAGAKIYLNGEPQQLFLDKLFGQKQNIVKSPAKIKNLLPGEYNVRLELDNYWPWQKKLEVHSGESTFAEDIILFKKDLPVLLENGHFSRLSLSPSSKYALSTGKLDISLFDLDEDTSRKYPIASSSQSGIFASSTKIIWSPKENRVIVNNLLFNINDWKNPIALNKLIGKNFSDIKWGKNENLLYFKLGDALLSLDLDNKRIKTLIPDIKISDFLVKNNYIYLVEKNFQQSIISVWDTDKNDFLRKVNLPYSDYRFIHPNSNLINLYDAKYHILYLIDPLSAVKPLRDSIANFTRSTWADESSLLYSDGSEIWLYNLNNNSKTLLTRVGKEITDLFMHPSKNYVIFTTDNSINTIELDDREKRNITKIMDINDLKWPYFDQRNKNLYFYAQIGNQAGLYKLAI